MGEGEKKPKFAVDPNSAKFKLNEIVAKHYKEVQEAKDRGEKSAGALAIFLRKFSRPWASKCAIPRIRQRPLRQEEPDRGCVKFRRPKVIPMTSVLMQESVWHI